MNKRSLSYALLALAGLWAVAAMAADSAQVVRATALQNAPYTDATRLDLLRAPTRVEILQRQGGWYQVRVNDTGQEGWVRMASLRLDQTAEAEEGSGWWASLFRTGRSSATWTTATTGIRGLSEADINNAAQDYDELATLDSYAVSAAEARTFAAQLPLKARQVAELPEED